MNRLSFRWMGRYFDIVDEGIKIGEVYYSISSKEYCVRIENEVSFNTNELKQILDFTNLENESNNSYA